MRRTSLEHADCPIARSLDVIGDWWSLLIVRDALSGRRRFGEFQKSLGLAKNILSARLRSLVTQGILESVPAADGSAWREYALTDKGRALFTVLVALREWGEAYRFEGESCPVELVDRVTGQRVQNLELRAADGRLLGPGDTRLQPRSVTP
jgi:DNA-binding HxlR family transcriptional regulator